MDEMKEFVGLSALLTGFSSSVLAPSLDPVDIKSLYLKTWLTNVAQESGDTALTGRILTMFSDLKNAGKDDQAIGEQLLSEQNPPAFVMACQQLIYLWYMGAWPQVSAQPGTETGGFTSFTTLSSDSYTSGLVWKVMQAHPMGDSNYRYGYWAEQPPALTDFTGN
jgi:hypothetical protein